MSEDTKELVTHHKVMAELIEAGFEDGADFYVGNGPCDFLTENEEVKKILKKHGL